MPFIPDEEKTSTFIPDETSSFVQDEESPKKTLWQTALTPISKLITGKSIGERADLLNKQGEKLATAYGKRGERIPSAFPEFFMLQLPAATAQALINTFDLSPLDVGIVTATAGAGKLPFGKTGLSLGDVAQKAPIGKGFNEAVKYQQTLKTITPLSSRGITTENIASAIPSLSTPLKTLEGTETSKINLSKYTPEVQEGIKKIMQANPELLNRNVVSHNQLDLMAQQLEQTPIVKKILSLPEGEMAAEILKVRQGEDAIIRSALTDDLTNLGANLKNILQLRQTQSVGRLATETGRALEQFKIPIEAQQEMANLINQKISQIKADKTLAGAKELLSGLIDLKKKVLSKDFNPSWFDKGYEFWLNNILSGPFTHSVNVVSNALFGGVLKPVEKASYAFFDSLISLGTKKREHYFSEIPSQIKGFGMALSGQPTIRTSKIGSLNIPRPGWKPTYELPIASGTKIEGLGKVGAIQGIKGDIIRLPTRGLVVEDNFAKRMTGFAEFIGRAEAIAKQEGLKGNALIARKNQLLVNPTEKLAEEVNTEQLYRTFQDSTGLGEFLKLLPQKGMRWVLPFRKTLSSILTKAVERTPAGFVKTAIKGVQSLKGIPYPQKELSVDLGNASLGTSLFAGVYYALKKGTITGAPPQDKAKRDVFYAQGKQPYSILMNGNYVPFNRFEPFGTAAMYMIDFLQGYEESDKEIPTSKLTDAVFKISYSLTNKTFLSGMTYLVQSLTDPERYGEEMLARTLGGFVPGSGLMRNIRQMADLSVRQPEGITERIASNIPGMSEKITPRVNSFGENVQRKPVGITRFTPFPITKAESNDIADELARLDISIGYPSKNMTDITGQVKSKLTREEYNQLLMKRGGTITKTLQNLVNSPYYQRIPDIFKKNLIDSIIQKTSKAVRTEMQLRKFQRIAP